MKQVIYVCLLMMTCFVSAASAAETRVALVIGNGAYRNAPTLRNPAADATAVATALRRLHFNVVLGTDLDQQAMISKLRIFRQASENAEIAIIYYSGHGIQVAGENWLLPVSAKLESDRDLQYEAVRVDSVLEETMGAKNLRVFVIDACRDNPFKQSLARSMGATRSAAIGRGLARSEPKIRGTLIAYATKADDVASDGIGNNSPFTSAFLKHVETPGVDVRLVFGKIRDSVMAETAGAQEPAIYASLGGDPIYLNPAVTQGAPSTADSTSTEIVFWNSIKDENNPGSFLEYKRQYPSGRFIGLADIKLKQLAEKSSSTPSKSADGTIMGQVSSYSPDGWPVIGGKVVRLYGVQSFPIKNIEFFKWFSTNFSTIVCQPRPGDSYRCLNQDNIDLSQAILLNGGSRATKDAITEYREIENRAKKEKRGIWKG
ncbi:caspase family protein [Magnetospirillum molischianum]|uniref:caspase family protein n=1 Tax=Magnetospirillum molischianum TaxID=1083 RepID=UPI00138B07D3|nr:caspase family protein [Magnetospirillum molischianum]